MDGKIIEADEMPKTDDAADLSSKNNQ